ncbi:Sporulation kinase E [Stieleria maiorica]|uniref:histidine kinase n=1 Tax=Stieleria maiorica TaxID=2795974 RepID=A0A5B9MN02_9BACT|nr:ATP-binding protein [Stieleria maiorica]QEG02782.1 Sporulation kinase E [Stieleria maiorica]
MKLRDKLGCFLPITGCVLLCLGVAGAWYVIELQKQNSHLLDVNVASIRGAEELELVTREMRHELDRFLLTMDRSYLLRAAEKQSQTNDWLSKARQLSASDQERAFVADLEQRLESYFQQLHELIDDPDMEISPQAVDTLEEKTLSEQVLVAAHDYLRFNESELQQSNQENQRLAQKLAMVMVFLGVCGAIAGLEAGYGVARAINRTMFMLSVPIRDVAGKLETVVGPVEVSADPSLQDLQLVLETVSSRVGSVVEQLHQRHQEIVRADQLAAVGKLAAGLAHELRNPLMCMKTLVQAAARNPDSASLNATDIAVLDEEITRVDSLLQTFLDFARPSEPQFCLVELAPIVRQTVDLVAGRAETRHIQIECQLPCESAEVRGDAMQLRQVLLNLLLNALDAVSNDGHISIAVERRRRGDTSHPAFDAAREWVCLSVADDGCGMPTDQSERNRMFEPFFSTKDPGLGLGLAISQRIIDAHGGRLVAEDRPEGGTVMNVILPLPSPVPLRH